MITFDSEADLQAFIDEALMDERFGEMWYNLGIDRVGDAGVEEDVVAELERIRKEEDGHIDTLVDIASRLQGGGRPPHGGDAEVPREAWESAASLRDALKEKREAEGQRERLYHEIAEALRRCDLDLDTDGLADTFDRIAAEEADHRDTLDRVLRNDRV